MNQFHFVGYDGHHPKSFVYETTIPKGGYLLVIFRSETWIRLNDGTTSNYPSGTAILYGPESHVCYGPCDDNFLNDWIQFSSDESFITNFESGVPFSVSDQEFYHNMVQLITWECMRCNHLEKDTHHSGLCDPVHTFDMLVGISEEEQILIDDLMRILFYRLKQDAHSSTKISFHERELLSLRRMLINCPEQDWTIEKMADIMHVSPSHLQLIYKQKFGVSCMEDVIHFRLNKACDYLKFTDLPIASISELCGYRTHEHFSRQFRRFYHLTPGQYRKQ